jgi:hypothetical protein
MNAYERTARMLRRRYRTFLWQGREYFILPGGWNACLEERENQLHLSYARTVYARHRGETEAGRSLSSAAGTAEILTVLQEEIDRRTYIRLSLEEACWLALQASGGQRVRNLGRLAKGYVVTVEDAGSIEVLQVDGRTGQVKPFAVSEERQRMEALRVPAAFR